MLHKNTHLKTTIEKIVIDHIQTDKCNSLSIKSASTDPSAITLRN